MRVVLVSPEYSTDAGGIGTNTSVTARALVRLGIATWVVTRGVGGGSEDDGVTVVRLPRRRGLARALFALPARRRVAAVVARLEPDVV